MGKLPFLAFKRETVEGTKECLYLFVLASGSLSSEPDGRN